MRDTFSTLIFDLDGTLSDPSLGVMRCIHHALESHGFPQVSPAVIRDEIGSPLDEIFLQLVPDASASVVDSLVHGYRQRYAQAGYAENEIYPAIPEAIRGLAEMGLNLGVCTSKRKDFAEKILALFDLSAYFAFVNGGDIGIRKAQQLAGLLASGAVDQDAVMIGDRSVDIQAARINGLRSIGVLWGFGSPQELAAAQPDHTVNDVAELLRLLR